MRKKGDGAIDLVVARKRKKAPKKRARERESRKNEHTKVTQQI